MIQLKRQVSKVKLQVLTHVHLGLPRVQSGFKQRAWKTCIIMWLLKAGIMHWSPCMELCMCCLSIVCTDVRFGGGAQGRPSATLRTIPGTQKAAWKKHNQSQTSPFVTCPYLYLSSSRFKSVGFSLYLHVLYNVHSHTWAKNCT